MPRNITGSDKDAVFAGVDFHKKYSVVTLGDSSGKVISQKKRYNSSTSYNNINITSTGVGGAINLGGSTGTTILAANGYSDSAIGNITLQATGATGAVNIGSNSSLTTYGESVASGNFLVQGSTINVGQYAEIASQGYGSSNSGNLTMASSGTGGLTIGQGSI